MQEGRVIKTKESNPNSTRTAWPQGNTNDLWEAFEKLYNFFSELTNHLILVAHLTRTAISKDTGEEIDATDIALPGKLKGIVCADMDGIAMLIRKDNQSILSFKTSPTDLVCGSRCEHLSGKEIVVTEKTDGGFVYHWDKIFI